MSRPINSEDLVALKVATWDLVKACGGVDRAAAITSLGKSTIARAYAERDEKDAGAPSWTTLDLVSVALLERDLAERGDPRRPVTECLARLGGRVLTDAEHVRARTGVAHAASAVMASFGVLAATVTDILADGAVTPTEGAIGDARAAEAAGALVQLRTAFAAAKAGGDR